MSWHVYDLIILWAMRLALVAVCPLIGAAIAGGTVLEIQARQRRQGGIHHSASTVSYVHPIKQSPPPFNWQTELVGTAPTEANQPTKEN